MKYYATIQVKNDSDLNISVNALSYDHAVKKIVKYAFKNDIFKKRITVWNEQTISNGIQNITFNHVTIK